MSILEGNKLSPKGLFMEEQMKPRIQRLTTSVLAVSALGLAGCASIPIYEQGLVSQDGMTFSENPVQNDQINLLSQIEPGSAVSGGGQAAGCTACR